MQACMEANNKRFDDFVRVTIGDISELKASLQFTQKELQEVKQSVKVNNDGNTAADNLLAGDRDGASAGRPARAEVAGRPGRRSPD